MIVVTMQTFALGTIVLPRLLVKITGGIPVRQIIKKYQVLQCPSQQRAIKGKELAVEAVVSAEMFHLWRKLIDKKFFLKFKMILRNFCLADSDASGLCPQ